MSYRRSVIGVFVLALAGLVGSQTAGGAGQQQGAASGTVSIIAKWTGDEQKSFEAVLAPFKKANPGITIKYTGGGDNVPQLVSTALAGGNPPDVATLPQPGTMRDFAKRNALKPITYAKAAIAKNFQPSWLQLGTVNGKLYGLFFKGANKSTVWYNVAAFKNAGVKTPTTWPAFLAAAKTIRASGAKAYSIGAADGWTLTDLFENIYLRTAGAAKYDQLSEHKIKWTDGSVKTALKTMAQVVSDSDNIAGGTSGALQTDFPTSVSNVFASSPKAAMVMEGDFVPGVVASSNPLKPISGYNQFSFPSIGGSKPAVMGGGDVVVTFRDTPAVRALVQYLATPQAATIWAQRGGYSSPNKNVKPGAYKDPLNRATAIALARASVFRFDLSDLQPAAFGSSTGQGMWKLLQDFVQKPSDVNGIAAKLEASAKKAYK
jgi:ABC-type glycerol-3-phosphate transport system substrate-binding protein